MSAVQALARIAVASEKLAGLRVREVEPYGDDLTEAADALDAVLDALRTSGPLTGDELVASRGLS